jgi:hypothetical protein
MKLRVLKDNSITKAVFLSTASARTNNRRAGMTTVRSIKLIKNADRKHRKIQIAVGLAVNPNRWSTAVRSWIVEFQEGDRTESLPAFDSLFTDTSSPLSPGAKSGSS